MISNGVPQWAVHSPSLFSLFLSSLPLAVDPGDSITSYAEDLTIVSQNSHVNTVTSNMLAYI